MIRGVVTLTEDDEKPGDALLHDPDCPMVQDHRIQGRPIITMMGIKLPIPPGLKCHSCID
jgi:hypothetical protein